MRIQLKVSKRQPTRGRKMDILRAKGNYRPSFPRHLLYSELNFVYYIHFPFPGNFPFHRGYHWKFLQEQAYLDFSGTICIYCQALCENAQGSCRQDWRTASPVDINQLSLSIQNQQNEKATFPAFNNSLGRPNVLWLWRVGSWGWSVANRVKSPKDWSKNEGHKW